ncbi:class E sortase [Streptomyces peucetius]|uniref:Class E sortase n=1 Tax=Streptomyces peucetius TaxID=1950 RepID=A0ABY6IKZ6_STRPE|nr:class E sortase [Streptomyces peucetius]UYQ66577.1 class E sortase [Streptomyces peucetius]
MAYDPLTDPVPPGGHGSPWFRDTAVPASDAQQYQPQSPQPAPSPQASQQEWQGGRYPVNEAEGYGRDWYAAGQGAVPAQAPAPQPEQLPDPDPEQVRASQPEGLRTPVSDPILVSHDETVALRTSDTRRAAETPPGPGRAERRRAAKGRGRKRPATRPVEPSAESAESAEPEGRPLSRVEARRAARAAKDSPTVIASRAIGELFITFGVLMLLFVTYQLWWTNVLAGQQADRATDQIQENWAKGRKPDAFEPGQGFAIMYIPKLDVVVPIAEGIDKHKVLDRGMVGHYGEGQLKTAMPEDKSGNFAVAGHRNTHGEPFRYINRLEPGDPIVVETQDTYYTYEMASILPQTPPSNVSVISPVPEQSGFTKPGRYITLTTCTPEFKSTYRMIVWGKMVDERPRSKGKPDALVG